MLVMFGFYVYGYGIASVLIDKRWDNPLTGKVYEISEVIAVTTSCIYSIMTIGGVVPLFPAIIRALICTKKVYEVIERVPKIKDEPGCIEEVQLLEKIEF